MLRVYACIVHEHDFRLVLVAGMICLLAAFTAFSILEQARAPAGAGARLARARRLRLGDRHLVDPFRRDARLSARSADRLRSRADLALDRRGDPDHRRRLVDRAARRALGGARRRRRARRRHRHDALYRHVGGQDGRLDGLGRELVIVSVAIGVAAQRRRRWPSIAAGRQPMPWRPALLFTLAICGLHFTAMAAARHLSRSRSSRCRPRRSAAAR